MNTTSLGVSKKLYEASQWSDPDADSLYTKDHKLVCSLYTVGYLLRSMPRINRNNVYADASVGTSLRIYQATWRCDTGEHHLAEADTPEDALGKLALALFDAGVLD